MSDYKNSSLPTSERVKDLLGRMTLEEKLGQMMQLAAIEENAEEFVEKYHIGSYLHALGEDINKLQKINEKKSRLGIPLIFAIDAIHGHCFEDGNTVFPVQLATACSWNSDLAKKIGMVTAKEASACGLHWTFSPVLCLGRDPRWGRTSETFGEDPVLASTLANALTEGYQNSGIPFAACAKHFAAYGETDGGRDSADAHTSERQLRNIFLPPFAEQAANGCKTFMAGYQSLNGIPCSANTWLLNKVLREEWGYEGVVVTDWNNVGQMLVMQNAASDMKEAVALCLAASNDIFMSTPAFFECALSLLQEGKIPESRIDDSVRRILSLKFELGLFDSRPALSREDVFNDESRWALALEAATQSVVLSKNQDVLPISNKVKKIALIGDNADDLLAHVGDWSFIPGLTAFEDNVTHRNTVVTFKSALEKYCADRKIELQFIPGCGPLQDVAFDNLEIDADVIIYCAGDTLPQYGEYHDRAKLDLAGNQSEVFEKIKCLGKPIVSIMLMSKPHIINEIYEGSDALLIAFSLGAKGGEALTNILFGERNPSGRLPISFPRCEGQLPVYYNQAPGWHSVLSPHFTQGEAYIDVENSPLLAFGEGLSYCEVKYSDVALSSKQLRSNGSITISLDVENSGDWDVVEVVQLYISQNISGVTSPKKRLLQFKRVNVPAHEKIEVRFVVDYADLEVLDLTMKKSVPHTATKLMLGKSSRDEDLKTIDIEVML